jgi:hypothetical protein
VYSQVWAGDEWVGFFMTRADADAWVKKQDDPSKFEINTKRPTPKERAA